MCLNPFSTIFLTSRIWSKKTVSLNPNLRFSITPSKDKAVISAELSRMSMDQHYKNLFFEFLAKNVSKSVEQIVSNLSDMGIAPCRIALESIEFPFFKNYGNCRRV